MRKFPQIIATNFLGNSPKWYKFLLVLFLILNPLLWFAGYHYLAGCCLVGEFIAILAMSLKCYPLPSGGLLAIEAVVIGMADPQMVYQAALANFPVILLLMFMVAAIFFMQDLLEFCFTNLLLKVKSKVILSLLFILVGAFLSAFLDALTVIAVIIMAAYGAYAVYHRAVTEQYGDEEIAISSAEFAEFRSFLRSIVMHGAVGTALGGVCTVVGEPQNLIIAHYMNWDFQQFFMHTWRVSIPVLLAGLLTCALVERFKLFSFGARLPQTVRAILLHHHCDQELSAQDKIKLLIQGIVGGIVVISLAFQLAEVGLIGLMVLILLTAFNGVIEEHQIGRAFSESLPFTALIVVFFAIVAVIEEQHLFQPLVKYVFSLPYIDQAGVMFLLNGLLSAVSDNVFVATIYIRELASALQQGKIDPNLAQSLAVAINMGTNLPSVATPNGQAAFLFLLTSTLAPLIRLSYLRMVWMALPYTLVMSALGYFLVRILT